MSAFLRPEIYSLGWRAYLTVRDQEQEPLRFPNEVLTFQQWYTTPAQDHGSR